MCAIFRVQRRVSPTRDPGHDKTESQGRVEIKAPQVAVSFCRLVVTISKYCLAVRSQSKYKAYCDGVAQLDAWVVFDT